MPSAPLAHWCCSVHYYPQYEGVGQNEQHTDDFAIWRAFQVIGIRMKKGLCLRKSWCPQNQRGWSKHECAKGKESSKSVEKFILNGAWMCSFHDKPPIQFWELFVCKWKNCTDEGASRKGHQNIRSHPPDSISIHSTFHNLAEISWNFKLRWCKMKCAGPKMIYIIGQWTFKANCNVNLDSSCTQNQSVGWTEWHFISTWVSFDIC